MSEVFSVAYGVRRPLQLARKILSIAVLAWLALALIPRLPPVLATGVDASWTQALNMAHARHLIVGRDVIYTMGPLGYLQYPDPDYASPRAVLLLLVATYAAFFYGVLRVAALAGMETAALVAFAAGIQALYWQHFPDCWLATCMVVLLAATASADRHWALDLAIAGSLAGFTLLLKFNDGLTLCAMFYGLLLCRLFRFQRWFPALALAALPPIVFGAGMTLQGGFGSTLAYLRNTLEIATGYSEAMSFAGPMWQCALAVVSVAFVVLAQGLFGERPRTMLPGLLLAFIAAATAFKHGMVREDGHAANTQAKLAVAALFVLLVAVRPRTRAVYATFTVLSALACVVVSHLDPTGFATMVDRRATLQLSWPAVRQLVSWNTTWDERRRDTHRSLGTLRLDPAFHQAIGDATVDAFPSRIDVIRANGLAYQPRPVLQSFVAYTPRLDRLNADHIAGPQAARFVLLQPETIDGRNMFFDDPLSLAALLDNYDLRIASTGAFLLEKRPPSPRFEAPQPMGQTIARWNEEIPVPQVGPDEAVMMKVDVRRTLWGRIWMAALRGAPVMLQASRKTSGQSFARVVRVNLASGVFISPLPRDLAEVAPYFGQFDITLGDPVVRILWWTTKPSEFEQQIRIEWYRLRFSK